MNKKHYLLVMLASVSFFSSDAQSKNKNDKVRVKIYSNHNGKIVNIDTTFINEKSADAFLRKNKFDVPAPPIPPIPPTPPDMNSIPPPPPIPPMPPTPRVENHGDLKHKEHQIQIYYDKEIEKEMHELRAEIDKIKDEIDEQSEELKNFHFEFFDNDEDNISDGKKHHIIIRDFNDGNLDTLFSMHFFDLDEMQKHMPCLDSMDFGYKYFYNLDDDDNNNGDKKRSDKIVIIKKEKRDDAKNKRHDELNKTEDKKSKSDYKLEPQNFSLSPNPGDGKYNLRFSLDTNEPVTIKVIDLKGAEVFSEAIKDFKGTYDNKLNIEGRLPGSYVLQLRQGNKLFTQKFVLK